MTLPELYSLAAGDSVLCGPKDRGVDRRRKAGAMTDAVKERPILFSTPMTVASTVHDIVRGKTWRAA